MKAKNRLLMLLSVMLTMSLLLAACSGGSGGNATNPPSASPGDAEASGEPEAPAEKIELDFWTFWGSETRRPIIEKMIADFNSSQDRIIVKHTYLPWGDIWTKNLAAIAAGNPPDVIINDINTIAQRASSKQVVNLSEFLAKDDIKGRFFPELWNTVEYNGEAYALPFNTDTRFLFYNKDAFAEVGLDPETPPKTWEELEQFAIKLDKKNGSRYERVGFYPNGWGNWGWDSWMYNADKGIGFVDKGGNVTIHTPDKVEALKWINKWTERLGESTVNAFKAEFGSQQADPFISGKVAMINQTATFYTQLRDYGKNVNFGIAPIPEYKPGSGHISSGGGFVIEMPYGAKHPEASWEFMKYMTDVQAQEYWAIKNFDNVANIEASEKAATNAELDEKGKLVYGEAVKNLKDTKIFPIPAFAPDFRSLLNPLAEAALLGQKTAEEALEQAQKEVEALVKANK
ncbi:ABC transporter substrate-binding protein [Paenibacillus arenilitoris]|uniref:ABC transporter substrate-binding protein n=1 Tax=Paenibacillus arenilitoris TaxID=2772299 RepID=A0A927CQX2_9BACL|nr:ABC transporter substrate-binding protein [Paenibacillus arenilitoris]MBD2872533.1 ABC transporter substrate-binding protein [Paenibacillus arenilitoris]